ncbi:MAG: pilin [Candidatus Pacebacteria bacterium]|nr:pilin [Candidatus Paceibacterota bacterium]
MQKKLFKNILFIAIFAGLALAPAAYGATEISYPAIFGHSITACSEITDYVVYFFIFFVALGAVAAFLVLFSAGIDFITSGGEPSKISSAKTKILGAFIGLIVLYSSYFILNTINPPQMPDNFSCDKNMAKLSVCVDVTKIACHDAQGNPIYQTRSETSIQSISNLNLQAGEKMVIKKYKNALEIWTFSEPDFKSPPSLAFRAIKNQTTGEYSQVSNLEIGPNIKSFKILDIKEGVYLYDKAGTNGYEVANGAISPLFLNESVNDLNSKNFDNKAQSISLIAPRYYQNSEEKIAPIAILFPEPKYRGVCVVAEGSEPNLGALAVPLQKNPVVYFGNNQLSSIIISSSKIEPSSTGGEKDYLGTVTFYRTLNCAETEEDKGCPIPIEVTSAAIERNIKVSCNGGKDFIVRSFKINGPGGVVLRGTNNRCQYWDSKSFALGNCISTITESDVYNPAMGGIIPKTFMVFPVNQ